MKSPRTFAQSALAALTFSGMAFIFPQASFATPVMDFHGEDVIPMAEELKPSLHLNANQEILWRTVEGKTRAIVREQQRRTRQLQGSAGQQMDNPGLDLRDLLPAIESESTLSSSENKQLRELWLTVNDALDDDQRQKVRAYIADRLQRVSDPASADSSAKPKSSNGAGRKGNGMGRGGMGGSGGNTNGNTAPGF